MNEEKRERPPQDSDKLALASDVALPELAKEGAFGDLLRAVQEILTMDQLAAVVEETTDLDPEERVGTALGIIYAFLYEQEIQDPKVYLTERDVFES